MMMGGKVRGRATSVLAAVALTGAAALAVPAPARAAAPGQNGEIAFVRDAGIWVAQPDGGVQRELLADADAPAWSADGTELAFVRDGAVWVSAADGSSPHEVIPDADHPTWSPSSDRIAFERDSTTWVAQADGSAARQVSPPADPTDDSGPPLAIDPDWSPDGTTIAVGSHYPYGPASSIYGVNPDGGDWRSLTEGYDDPDWAPGGQQIVHADSAEEFHHDGVAVYVSDVGDIDDPGVRISPEYVPDPDTGARYVTSGSPSWSPDGSTILFQSDAAADLGGLVDAPGLWTYSVADRTSHLVIPDASEPDWQPATGPDCTAATATPSVLRPANGRFRLVQVALAGAQVHIRSVRSDEPRGRHLDWVFVPGLDRLLLRAERSAHGDGRVYTVGFTASGPTGHCRGTVEVTVPR